MMYGWPCMLRNLRELYQYRGLLLSLTQRELKARYRNSVLGFLWTFLNPMLQMGVYSLLFTVYMRQKIEGYTYFVFVGLLPWIWFSTSLGAGASSISDRRDLLTKVRFPAQVLPATVVVTNLCNYVLSLPLMIGLGLILGYVPTWHIIAFPVVLLTQLSMTVALVYIVSALNVTFRDLQQIIANLLTMWFFVTPVFYRVDTLPDAAQGPLVLLNPMAVMVTSYQSIFYEHRLPNPGPLLMWMGVSLALLWVAAGIFERRREDFAEFI
ncbi:ABC transporter permease [Corallococcus praedator]|uniref:Transport permease protein n=2 Tax=Myxococcaceae TaxID=31 RepID=A0ABX9QMS7_9BACT|nr:ABC transporter permease [Corallococcus sp. CA047B]RKH36255.1 ABC transporter permease [Corallococcus sp. CA031C]RKI13754.1 ABC transporter permease [Corallococcus praedator]